MDAEDEEMPDAISAVGFSLLLDTLGQACHIALDRVSAALSRERSAASSRPIVSGKKAAPFHSRNSHAMAALAVALLASYLWAALGEREVQPLSEPARRTATKQAPPFGSFRLLCKRRNMMAWST